VLLAEWLVELPSKTADKQTQGRTVLGGRTVAKKKKAAKKSTKKKATKKKK
jgi:hypothetical protein